VGLIVDLDLLAAAELTENEKQAGAKLLRSFHAFEESIEEYIEALEENIEANERLSKKYEIAGAIAGGIAGLSSPAVIFATAAVAVPITGAVWIAVGLSIDLFDIAPEIETAKQRLEEAHRLIQLFPDTITAFRGLVFTDSSTEANKRFRQWQTYVENHRNKLSRFFGTN
jgi:ABC-type multidrug transport system fused ATPase/permease subunit